jgi:hypothetical protein
MKLSAGALALTVLAHAATLDVAEAQYKPRYEGPRVAEGYRYVTIKTDSGRKRITAPVRRGPYGDEILVPDIGWIKCGWNCQYTLQKNVLDPARQWGKDAHEPSPGYLTWQWSW